MFLHCPNLKWRPLTCTDLMDVLAAIDLLDIYTRCKPPFCIGTSPILFRTGYLFCLTTLKMRCHMIGVHLMISIYPHKPQFCGWYGVGKALRLETLYQNLKEDLYCKGTGQLCEKMFGFNLGLEPSNYNNWLTRVNNFLGSRVLRANNRSVCRLDLVCWGRVVSWLVRLNKSPGGIGLHKYGSRAHKSIFTIKILLKNINWNNKVQFGWLEGGGGWTSSEDRRTS